MAKAKSAPRTDSERNLAAALAAGSKIVPAVGIGFAVARTAGEQVADKQAAMLAAVDAAQREGVTDQREIRRRALAARDSVGS